MIPVSQVKKLRHSEIEVTLRLPSEEMQGLGAEPRESRAWPVIQHTFLPPMKAILPVSVEDTRVSKLLLGDSHSEYTRSDN